MGKVFWEEGCHRGVTVRSWGVTVEDWDVTVGEIGVKCGTMIVTVEGWFITVVEAWWVGSAEQGEQIKPPMTPRENMDLRVDSGSSEQVEWTHLLQRRHWTEVRPTSREQTEQRYMGFVGKQEWAGVTVDIAASKQKEEYKETSDWW